MTKKIFEILNPFVLSIFVFINTFFICTSTSIAAQVNSDINEDNPLGIVIEQSNQTDTNSSSSPDLGDDQAFPFIPGFGKNSGKD
tara:strand:+ start:299 stop:553 length:255 start_codon:yes stop_codon:yes gene_type:complete